MAQRAADASRQVDGADLEDVFMAVAGDHADAIDRADRHTGLTAGTHVFVKQRENFGDLLLGHQSSHCTVRARGGKLESPEVPRGRQLRDAAARTPLASSRLNQSCE